jgi:hypothetical protein
MLKENILGCLRRGRPVFPAGPDKAPLTAQGFKSATTDKETILGWWKTHPKALMAVPTGKQSGLLVIDVDPDGARWYAEHQLELKCRRVHKTPRGHHLLYLMPDADIPCSASKLASGVDVRADGGYVVWWPGHGYKTVGDLDDIGPPPKWLLDKLKSADAASEISSCSRISRGGNVAYSVEADH